MFRALLLQGFFIITFCISASLADVPAGLELRGKGEIRYLGIFKVYEAYLYTDSIHQDKDVLSAKCSRCLKIDYAMDLSAKDIIEASEVVLQRQHDKSTLTGVKTELELLYQKYKDVKQGDIYTLCYDSQSQKTSVILNNTLLVQISSPDFAAIYFGIWLLEKNALDDRLRKKLLSSE